MNQRRTIAETIVDKIAKALKSKKYKFIPDYEDILSENIEEFSQVPEIKIPANHVANIISKFNSDGYDSSKVFEILKNIISKTNVYSKGETCILLSAIHCEDLDFTFRQCIELLSLFTASELCTKIAHCFPPETQNEYTQAIHEKNQEIKKLRKILQIQKNQCTLPRILYKPKNFTSNLFEAVKAGNLPNVQYLIEHCRMEIESLDINKNTPLLVACFEGNISIVQYLIAQKHANIKATNIYGRNCFHMAAAQSNIQIIQYLINVSPNDFNINLCDNYGNSALHYASFYSRDFHTVQFLLENGANKFLRNKYNETPYDICGHRGSASTYVIKDMKDLLEVTIPTFQEVVNEAQLI